MAVVHAVPYSFHDNWGLNIDPLRAHHPLLCVLFRLWGIILWYCFQLAELGSVSMPIDLYWVCERALASSILPKERFIQRLGTISWHLNPIHGYGMR